MIIKCKTCGKEFKAYANEKRKYCSHGCYAESKKRLSCKMCENCGEIYFPKTNKSNKRFCSRECYLKDKRENLRNIMNFYCKQCNRIFSKSKKTLPRVNGKIVYPKYCCKKCVDKARIGKYCAENSPNWKNGMTMLQDLIRKSADYIKTRTECFERDGFVSYKSKDGGVLIHHHIVPMAKIIETYGITKDNWRNFKPILFDIGNVVTLTRKEHKRFHSLFGKNAGAKEFCKFLSM